MLRTKLAKENPSAAEYSSGGSTTVSRIPIRVRRAEPGDERDTQTDEDDDERGLHARLSANDVTMMALTRTRTSSSMRRSFRSGAVCPSWRVVRPNEPAGRDRTRGLFVLGLLNVGIWNVDRCRAARHVEQHELAQQFVEHPKVSLGNPHPATLRASRRTAPTRFPAADLQTGSRGMWYRSWPSCRRGT